MADAPGPEYLLPLPLAVHLAHHGRQIAGEAERQPAPRIVVERDGAGAHPGRVDARLGGSLPDARVVLTADRKSVVSGKSVSVRVALGGRRIIQKKKQQN